MKINTKQVEMVLMNRAISAYQIEKETGVNQSAISRLRSGERPIENMALSSIMKIQKWIDAGNFRFGYDYSEILEELQKDISEGLVDDEIFIVRGDYLEEIDCQPIIDYYYSSDQIEEGDLAEKIKTSSVLDEMKKFNKLF